jgi:uncharacterized protein (TIGR02996 family)
MTERKALLAAVCASPEDDTPRLVFADWLDENGEPERAEFIRVQVDFAALLRSAASGTEQPGRRARDLWIQHGKAWQQELPQIKGVVWHDGMFSRGFVERVTVASDTVLVHHTNAIFTRVPIQHLVIQRFMAVDGFSTLTGLRGLRTLSLTNHEATERIVRALILCEALGESTLLMCYFRPLGIALQEELRRKFGEQLYPSPEPPVRPQFGPISR